MPYKDRETRLAYWRNYTPARRASSKKYGDANREKIRNRQKLYTATPEAKAHRKAYLVANREATAATERAYRETHREALAEKKVAYAQKMTPYLHAMREMVRETMKQLPNDAVRRQFAAEMVHDSLFADVAYRCHDVEEFIVQYFEPEALVSVEEYEDMTDQMIGARRYAKILAGILLAA